MKWFEKWKEYTGEYGLQQLNEADMTRVLTKYVDDGFIVITSDRTCEAEKGLSGGDTCSAEESAEQDKINHQNYKEMVAAVRGSGFGYIPAFGGYKEKVVDKDTGKETSVDTDKPENSIIIVARPNIGKDHEALKALGIEIAKKYNQDSFFYKPPNPEDTKAYYIDRTGGVDMEFSSFRPEDVAQEFYTQLKKGRKRRFTALPENLEKIIYLRQHPKSVWEARRRYGEIFLRFQ